MHCKSYSHFFSKELKHICVPLDENFNESLTNDVVSFEQLGPGVLLQVSLCGSLLTVVHPSSLCPSVTIHVFDNSIRTLSIVATILKVFICYLLPNCLIRSVPMSKMAIMVAILKIMKRHPLPNGKLDEAETWWKASEQHGDLELLKWFLSDI